MKPTNESDTDEILPTWDQQPPPIPMAVPVGVEPLVPVAVPVSEPAPASPASITCRCCGTVSPLNRVECHDCGYHFTDADRAAAQAGGRAKAQAGAADAAIPMAVPVAAEPAEPAVTLQGGRFELGEKVAERQGVVRYRGLDRGNGSRPPAPVFIIQQKIAAPPPQAQAASADSEEILPTFDDFVAGPSTDVLPGRPTWPGITWEKGLLELEHPGLPRQVDHFAEGDFEYLVEEIPTGQLLWDAWDDQDRTSYEKYTSLIHVAEALHSLHQYNAILEGLRPDIVVVTPEGQARITELTDLLPIPLVEGANFRGTAYTAPELLAGHGNVDFRADLYGFGAMLYALHVGRELNEKTDFDRPGVPKPFIPRFPDIHPAFGRLMSKTFRKEPDSRFPTDEAGKEDPTGFLELIRTLGVMRRTIDNVRLEIASWTTIGIVRTGNEDAFAVLHATESRQDDLGESALVILCDGMGGYEAGEVAAAMAISVIRQYLSKQKMFSHLAGGSPFPGDPQHSTPRAEGHAGPALDVEACKLALKTALREANKQIYTASRVPGSKRRGMGCTAEVVYVDGRNVVVGHVGDSRTYHLHEGRLIQLTRDQTLVNRLVELGSLSPEDALTHPRRNELQQAIGGQPDVEPGVYHGVMSAGDWVMVCSDGVTNHVTNEQLQEMLQVEASSAEIAARRLVNLTNIEGATDNATVVVIRAT